MNRIVYIWIILLVGIVTSSLTSQHINEFHYDNVGSDTLEFIEVVIPDPQPVDLTEYRIVLYNGADSMTYDGRSLNNITPACSNGLCYYIWAKQPFIQNGPRDGIAMVKVTNTDTTVFDFISYEGTLLAKDGLAIGEMSADIGISEDGSPLGHSLQKRPGQSSWFAGPATRGSVNPIELLSFEGTYLREKEGVLLEWSTASELNNHYFEVQKSRDQRSFWPVSRIPGAGNSQEILEYSYFDEDLYQGTMYYRLKQVDFSGAYAYSPVIAIENPVKSALADMVPLLHNGVLYFKDTGYRPAIDITLYNVLGKRLWHRKQVYGGDIIPVNFPVDGIIFVQLRSQGLQHTGRIMILGQ